MWCQCTMLMYSLSNFKSWSWTPCATGNFTTAFHEDLHICHSLALVEADQKENIQPNLPSLWGMQYRLNQDIYNNYDFLFSSRNICVIFTISVGNSDLDFTGRSKRSEVPNAASDYNIANITVTLGNGFLYFTGQSVLQFCLCAWPQNLWVQPHIQLELLVNF